MKFEFETKNIEIFIPSGRLGNLKEQLGWNNIEFSTSEIENTSKDLAKQFFDVNYDFGKRLEYQINNFAKNTSKKEERKIAYSQICNEQSKNFDYSSIKKYLFEHQQVFSELIIIVGKDLSNNSQIKEKINKLKQLQLINQK